MDRRHWLLWTKEMRIITAMNVFTDHKNGIIRKQGYVIMNREMKCIISRSFHENWSFGLLVLTVCGNRRQWRHSNGLPAGSNQEEDSAWLAGRGSCSLDSLTVHNNKSLSQTGKAQRQVLRPSVSAQPIGARNERRNTYNKTFPRIFDTAAMCTKTISN